MYEFSDAIDKVSFDEEFSDVADNIKKDCRQLESINFSDAVVKINEWIDKVFNPCKCSIIDYPEWFKIVVWRVLYNELKANPQARQTERIENNINLPKDVFGKKYWNMYSPDMKLQQEKYDNLFLPFNYAQVECNTIYRAMIHHIICNADICTDSIVDVFGKFGLVPALCANGYKHKVVYVYGDDYDILTKIQPAFKKKLKIYKHIEKVQEFLKRSYPYEQKEKVSEILGLSSVLFNLLKYTDDEDSKDSEDSEDSEDSKDSEDNKDSEGKKYKIDHIYRYDIYFLSAYFIMYKCLMPEYWIDSYLEVWRTKRLKSDGVKDSDKQEYDRFNKKYLYDKWVSQWINEGQGFKERVQQFINWSKDDIFEFMEAFIKIEFQNINFIYELNVNSESYVKWDGSNKDFLFVDMPKYITEYKRFDFDKQKALDVLQMLGDYEGNWILTWKTYVEKDSRYKMERGNKKDTDIKFIRDRMYTKERTVTDKAYKKDVLAVVNGDKDFDIKELYSTISNIDEKQKLYVFNYRDENRNKPQSIVFITNVNFENINDVQFQQRYNLQFDNMGSLRKRTYKEFYKEIMKWQI